MNKFTHDDIVQAFTGIHQVAMLVQQLASTGRCDEAAFSTSINSIFFIDAPTVASIYGSTHGLKLGLKNLHKIFQGQGHSNFDKQIARLVMSLIHVERHLKNNKEKTDLLKRKIYFVKGQAKFFNMQHPIVIAALAKVYEDIISTLPFKVGILGKKELLTSPDIMEKIRALLLAGVRSAVLWQQIGGSRWQLLFARQRYKKSIINLLKACDGK